MDHSTHTTSKRHLWLMVICCLIPVVALVGVRLLSIPVNGTVLIILLALCPLSHIALMWVMMRGSQHQ